MRHRDLCAAAVAAVLLSACDADVGGDRVEVTISPATAVDEPVLGVASGSQQEPRVVSNGTHYLVNWRDSREWETGTSRGGHAARVSANGELVDPIGIPFGPAVGPLASDRSRFWAFGLATIERLSDEGTAVDDEPIMFTTSAFWGNPTPAAAAFDGEQMLVVGRGDDGVVGVRVRRDGTRIEKQWAPILISSGGAEVAVAFGGSHHLVVWTDGTIDEDHNWAKARIVGARVDRAGAVLDAAPIQISPPDASRIDHRPAIAAGAGLFFVGWNGPNGLQGTRVDPAGAVLDDPPLEIGGAGRERFVAFDGESFVVAWERSEGEIGVTRVSAAGVVLDPEGIVVAVDDDSHDANVELASNGEGVLVVWERWPAFNVFPTTVHGARVGRGGAVLDPEGIVLGKGYNAQFAPALAAGADGPLLAWQDTRRDGKEADIYGIALDDPGAPRGRAAPLSPAGTACRGQTLLAHGAGKYLAVCVAGEEYHGHGISLLRSSSTSASAGPPPRPIELYRTEGTIEEGALAAAGKHFVLAWNESASTARVQALRISPEGDLLDPRPITLFADDEQQQLQRQLALAVVDDRALVIVATTRERDGQLHHAIRGVRLAADGAVLDQRPLLLSPPSAAAKRDLAAIGAGDHYWVAWAEEAPAPEKEPSGCDALGCIADRTEIVATRVGRSGAPLDDGLLPLAASVEEDARQPNLAFDGENLLVTWNAFAAGESGESLAYCRTLGQLWTPEGVPLSAEPFAVRPDHDFPGFDGRKRALIATAPGRFVHAFSTFDTERDVRRLRLQTIDYEERPAAPERGCVCSGGGDAPAPPLPSLLLLLVAVATRVWARTRARAKGSSKAPR